MSTAIIIVVLLILLAFVGYLVEKREWNNGICKHSGKPWKSFEVDSTGAVGYKDGEGNYLWISWNSITKDHQDNDEEIER